MLNFIIRLLSSIRDVPALSGKRPQPFRPGYLYNVTRLFILGQFIVLAAALLLSGPASPARAAGPDAVLAPLLGTPYRDDGVDDAQGNHTLFANQTARFATSGYNCSGFVTTAARPLLGRKLPLDAVQRDRKGDSGPGSPAGQDWDFGYDLILNITDGLPRRLLLPQGPGSATSPAPVDPAGIDAARFRGFPLHDTAAWKQVLASLRPGEIALATLSKPIKGRLYYYHVGLLIPDGRGAVFFYHATPGRGTHRLNLAAPDGMAAFSREFAEQRFGEKTILLVAVPLPR